MSLSNKKGISPMNNGCTLGGLRTPQRDPNEVGLSSPGRRKNRIIVVAAAMVVVAVAVSVSVAVVLMKGDEEDSKEPGLNEALSPPVNPPATFRPTPDHDARTCPQWLSKQ
jgi:hypothetical protein